MVVTTASILAASLDNCSTDENAAPILVESKPMLSTVWLIRPRLANIWLEFSLVCNEVLLALTETSSIAEVICAIATATESRN